MEGETGRGAEEADSIANVESADGQPCTVGVIRKDAYLNVTIITGLLASILFWTKAPPSCSQLAPEPRVQPLTKFMTSDRGMHTEGMIYEPMDPDHDRQARVVVCMGRACDVEVQTLKLILGQELFGELALDDPEQLTLEADVPQLRADWAVTDGLDMAITCKIGVYTDP